MSAAGSAVPPEAAAGAVRAPLALLISTLRPSRRSVGVATGGVGRAHRIMRRRRGLAGAACAGELAREGRDARPVSSQQVANTACFFGTPHRTVWSSGRFAQRATLKCGLVLRSMAPAGACAGVRRCWAPGKVDSTCTRGCVQLGRAGRPGVRAVRLTRAEGLHRSAGQVLSAVYAANLVLP